MLRSAADSIGSVVAEPFRALGEWSGFHVDTVGNTAARPVLPEDLFGSGSALAAARDIPAAVTHTPLTDNIVVKLTAIGCFVGFCLVMYYFRGYFNPLIRTIASRLYDDVHFEEQNKVFSSFLTQSAILGWFTAALCGVKFTDIYFADRMREFPEWVSLLLLPAIVAAGAAIYLYRKLVMGAAGRLAFASGLTEGLEQTRKRLFALFSLTMAPVGLLFVFSHGPWLPVFSTLIATIAAAAVILLIYKSYRLFVEQNVSILDWILYLCAVEIFPVSFLLALVLRGI